MSLRVGDEQLLLLPDLFGQLPVQILSRRRRREYGFVDHVADDALEGRKLPLQVAIADWLAIVLAHGRERPGTDRLAPLNCLQVVLEAEPQRPIRGHLKRRRHHEERLVVQVVEVVGNDLFEVLGERLEAAVVVPPRSQVGSVTHRPRVTVVRSRVAISSSCR